MKTPEITIVPRLSYEVLIDGKPLGVANVTTEWNGILQLKLGKGEVYLLRKPGLAAIADAAVGTGKPEVVTFVKGTPALTEQILGTASQAAGSAPASATNGDGTQTA